MTNILDDYALMSPLRHRNNWLKLAIVLFGLLVGVSSTSPITPLFIALCMSFTTVALGRAPLKLYLKLLLAPVGFALTGVVIIAFFSGSGQELLSFELAGYPLSVRADGLELALLVLSQVHKRDVLPLLPCTDNSYDRTLCRAQGYQASGIPHRAFHADLPVHLCFPGHGTLHKVCPDCKT